MRTRCQRKVVLNELLPTSLRFAFPTDPPGTRKSATTVHSCGFLRRALSESGRADCDVIPTCARKH